MIILHRISIVISLYKYSSIDYNFSSSSIKCHATLKISMQCYNKKYSRFLINCMALKISYIYVFVTKFERFPVSQHDLTRSIDQLTRSARINMVTKYFSHLLRAKIDSFSLYFVFNFWTNFILIISSYLTKSYPSLPLSVCPSRSPYTKTV